MIYFFRWTIKSPFVKIAEGTMKVVPPVKIFFSQLNHLRDLLAKYKTLRCPHAKRLYYIKIVTYIWPHFHQVLKPLLPSLSPKPVYPPTSPPLSHLTLHLRTGGARGPLPLPLPLPPKSDSRRGGWRWRGSSRVEALTSPPSLPAPISGRRRGERRRQRGSNMEAALPSLPSLLTPRSSRRRASGGGGASLPSLPPSPLIDTARGGRATVAAPLSPSLFLDPARRGGATATVSALPSPCSLHPSQIRPTVLALPSPPLPPRLGRGVGWRWRWLAARRLPTLSLPNYFCVRLKYFHRRMDLAPVKMKKPPTQIIFAGGFTRLKTTCENVVFP